MSVDFSVPPYAYSGRVYGSILNHQTSIDALGDEMFDVPYKNPPSAPILYVKPRNTLARSGSVMVVPSTHEVLQINGCLGLVIGETASRVTRTSAISHLAGYTAVIDVSVPHQKYYRPSVRFKALDGSCVVGELRQRDEISDPNKLLIKVAIDRDIQQEVSLGACVRDVEQLLVDVTEFMTLQPGDILLTGLSVGAPEVKRDQIASISIGGIGDVSVGFDSERVNA